VSVGQAGQRLRRRGGLALHRRWLVLLLVGSLLAACGSSSPTAPPDTGIKGVVTVGPTCPVERVGEPPCVAPLVATLAITSADDGSVVTRVTSADDGTFTVDVPPGDYVIVPEPAGDPYPFGQPVEVTVEPGTYAEVEVAYDSGIR
jgi:hypothetical protein